MIKGKVSSGDHMCYFVELSSTVSVQSRKYWVGDLCSAGFCFYHKEQASEDISLHFKTSMFPPPSPFTSYDCCVALVLCSFHVLETSGIDAKCWVFFGCFEICFPTEFEIRGEVLRILSMIMFLLTSALLMFGAGFQGMLFKTVNYSQEIQPRQC